MRSWKELVTCPYKPEHQVSINRFQKHLVKCSKEHKTSQFEVCWLNSSHHIPQQEMASHLRTCPDRKVRFTCSICKPPYHLTLNKPPYPLVHFRRIRSD